MKTVAEPRVAAGRSAQSPGQAPVVVVSVALLTVSHRQLLAMLLAPAPAAGEREPWVLPRRELHLSEALEDSARLCARQAAGSDPAYLEQLYTVTSGTAASVVEVSYLALVRPPALAPPANGPERQPRPKAEWRSVDALPPVQPAHQRILDLARQRLRSRLGYSSVAGSLLAQEFSLTDLQELYEVVQGRALDKRNFRKWVLANHLVEPTHRERRDGPHRPARLYRFAGVAPPEGTTG